MAKKFQPYFWLKSQIWVTRKNLFQGNFFQTELVTFNQRRIQDLWKGGGGGGGRESKFLDAAPENNKNRPKKQKSAEKKGGGGRGRFAPPPQDPPLPSTNC